MVGRQRENSGRNWLQLSDSPAWFSPSMLPGNCSISPVLARVARLLLTWYEYIAETAYVQEPVQKAAKQDLQMPMMGSTFLINHKFVFPSHSISGSEGSELSDDTIINIVLPSSPLYAVCILKTMALTPGRSIRSLRCCTASSIPSVNGKCHGRSPERNHDG